MVSKGMKAKKKREINHLKRNNMSDMFVYSIIFERWQLQIFSMKLLRGRL